MFAMLALAKLKVVRMVVLLIAIDVIDGLIFANSPTEFPGHHKAVFKDVTVGCFRRHVEEWIVFVDLDVDVPFVDVPSALPSSGIFAL